MNRLEQIENLKQRDYDLLIIGGGATGTGAALDAASRGLKVALVERSDFSSGTSSRSTKLIHGGVRYLEQAVKKLDRSQFNLVRDALKERATLLQLAPHLAHPLPLVTPLYNPLQVPYFMTGLKLYDRLAGKANLGASHYVGSKKALERFPMLKKEGLVGAVIYYDGQFDDARMNVTLALSAAEQGAVVANYVEVTALHKHNDTVSGARLRDTLSGEMWDLTAKAVINATGPFADEIRLLDNPATEPMVTVSSGIHIVLDGRFSPPDTGLLIPETEDGRVLFLLPWLGHTLVGTTDHPAEIEPHPKASEEDIAYVLRHVANYFDMPVSHADIKATFSGLRPLISDPKAVDTARLSRDHVIHTSASGLITIAGGKWTTYRKMALDVIDEALKVGDLSAQPSQTETIMLRGAQGYSPKLALCLQQEHGLAGDIAVHLSHAYGQHAKQIAEQGRGLLGARLSEQHPYTLAEARYVIQQELAQTVIDVLMRRLRLGVLDKDAALAAIPHVARLFKEEHHWDDVREAAEIEAAQQYVQ